MTLMATRRLSARSRARYTAAIPPRPSSVKISYSPAVAACSRAPTIDHGGARSEEVATVGADGSTRSVPRQEQIGFTAG